MSLERQKKKMPLYNQPHCFCISYNNEGFILRGLQKQSSLRLDTKRKVWETSLLLGQFPLQFPLNIWPTQRSFLIPLYHWLMAYFSGDLQAFNSWHPERSVTKPESLVYPSGKFHSPNLGNRYHLHQKELLHALGQHMPGSRLPSSLPVPAQTPGKWDSFREGLDGVQFKDI